MKLTNEVSSKQSQASERRKWIDSHRNNIQVGLVESSRNLLHDWLLILLSSRISWAVRSIRQSLISHLRQHWMKSQILLKHEKFSSSWHGWHLIISSSEHINIANRRHYQQFGKCICSSTLFIDFGGWWQNRRKIYFMSFLFDQLYRHRFSPRLLNQFFHVVTGDKNFFLQRERLTVMGIYNISPQWKCII